ncbi:GNAT family N-acetyltransferase [Labrys neptuniae]
MARPVAPAVRRRQGDPVVHRSSGRVGRGGGQASEAAREVLRYAFDGLALERVTAEAASRNSALLRILAKLGFAHIESFIDEADGECCERFALDGTIGSSLLSRF